MYIIIIILLLLFYALQYILLGKIFWFTQIIFFNPRSKKIVLTFDDGPHPRYTREIIEILKEYKITATFFVCGKESKENPQVIHALIKNGHTVANHSWNHLNMIFKSPKKIKDEIIKTDNLLRALGVEGEIYFRTPFRRFIFITPYIASKLKKKIILWSIASKDYKSKSVEEISQRVIKRCRRGGIVVMHDGRADRSLSVQALKKIIPELLAKNYEFSNLSDYLSEK